MDKEIKEILYYFEKYHFEDTMIDGKETKLLYDYITNLQSQLQQKENIIKEVREYITSQKLHKIQDTTGALTYREIKLLEILDKENK